MWQIPTSHTARGHPSTSLTEEGEPGFWVVDEDTGEEGFTGLYTETEFWVLGAKGSYSRRRIHGWSFKRKENPRVMERKENDHDQVSSLGLAEKAMLHHKKMTRTRLFGDKGKGKGKRARKENSVRILSKECLHGRAKARVMANPREESKTFNNNLHKHMMHSSHH